MDSILLTMLVGAAVLIAAGARMLYCGHRHQVRRDRRSTDQLKREPYA